MTPRTKSEMVKRYRSQVDHNQNSDTHKRSKKTSKPPPNNYPTQKQHPMSEGVRDHLQLVLVEKMPRKVWSHRKCGQNRNYNVRTGYVPLGIRGQHAACFDSSVVARGYRIIVCEDRSSPRLEASGKELGLVLFPPRKTVDPQSIAENRWASKPYHSKERLVGPRERNNAEYQPKLPSSLQRGMYRTSK